MYCSHCGKKFDERALEKKKSSYVNKDENGELLEIDSDARIEYVCPQCGHLIFSIINTPLIFVIIIRIFYYIKICS